MVKNRGTIYLYTGEGGGKTTNALGLALRCLGHGYRVVIIQFLKWWKNTGEYKFQKKFQSLYKIHQFGRKGWIGLGNLDERDKELARKGLEFAKKIVKEKPRLLVLDEINLALHCELLEVNEVIDFLKTVPKETNVVLTGRYAPRELVIFADFVNEIVDVKHPEEIPTVRGIQF
ncbi:MAG: cob(I)yrinic acid a,c-diamide adenosyltransferase [Candidatus Bathyarchaeota archaeon]|nr:MAG: cob(I)yrinic acid a,c-diamide adenosyltransferase [Candidatus Bathyarchaeota archaeon]